MLFALLIIFLDALLGRPYQALFIIAPIALALAFGIVFDWLGSNFALVYSTNSIVLAFVCSSLIGIAFGFLPARRASLLDPVAALANARQ